MRKLVVVSRDIHIRNVVTSGALDVVEDDETYFVASATGVQDPSALQGKPGYLGTVSEPSSRLEVHARLKRLMLHSFRSRSQTIRDKVAMKRGPVRRSYKARLGRLLRRRFDVRVDLVVDDHLWHSFATLPGIRQYLARAYTREAGFNKDLHRVIRDLRPDVVIVPTSGVEMLPHDAIVSARKLEIPSLAVVINWDNLSSKGAFAVQPDWMAVWGEQSAEHADRIHGFPRNRVAVIGVPTFDGYFRHPLGSTESPFPFRYALFAGCFAKFDEAAALSRLDRAISERGLDLKIVYRPHPHRLPRDHSDFVDEGKFGNVIIDPQVRDVYIARAQETERSIPIFPALDYYPALLENAEFVVCPLSTMIVESAIFERRVIVIAYHDGIHEDSPATRIDMDHFDGMDRVEGFEVCRSPEDLDRAFAALVCTPTPTPPPLRDQIGWWLYHDHRTYSERLAELLARIDRERGSKTTLRSGMGLLRAAARVGAQQLRAAGARLVP